MCVGLPGSQPLFLGSSCTPSAQSSLAAGAASCLSFTSHCRDQFSLEVSVAGSVDQGLSIAGLPAVAMDHKGARLPAVAMDHVRCQAAQMPKGASLPSGFRFQGEQQAGPIVRLRKKSKAGLSAMDVGEGLRTPLPGWAGKALLWEQILCHSKMQFLNVHRVFHVAQTSRKVICEWWMCKPTSVFGPPLSNQCHRLRNGHHGPISSQTPVS